MRLFIVFLLLTFPAHAQTTATIGVSFKTVGIDQWSQVKEVCQPEEPNCIDTAVEDTPKPYQKIFDEANNQILIRW